MKKILFLFTLLISLGVVLVSCGGGNNTTKSTYKITFDSNGGSAVQAITGEEGVAITAPTNPTKEGFEFEGWYLNNSLYEFTTMPNINITLVAKWKEVEKPEPTLYTITFDEKGGSDVEDITAAAGSQVVLPTSTKEGYNFLGWYIGEAKYVQTIMPEANITVVAKWEEIVVSEPEYTITLDVQGGSSVENIIGKEGTLVVLPTPTKEGYNFLGWYLDEVLYTATLMGSEDITLVAKWEEVVILPTEYTIAFDAQGGSDVENITDIAGAEIILPIPTKEGYTFLGWYLGDTKYEETVMGEANITLVAKWKESVVENITITYVLNGGNALYPTHEDMVSDFLTDFNATTGKALTDASELYSSGNVFHLLFNDPEKGAKWRWILEYLLVLWNEGYGNHNDAKTEYETFLAGNGSSALHWAVRENIQGLMTNARCASYSGAGAIDFSQYEINSRTQGAINGGKHVVETQTNAALLSDVYRFGYKLEGWYSDAELTNKVISADASTTLYAKWEKTYSTLTYVLNNNAASMENDTVSVHVSDTFDLVNPTYNELEWTFNGWFSDEACTLPIYTISTRTSSDIKVYASWTKLSGGQVQLNYVLNGGNWAYPDREAMVEDFLDDAMEWGGKTSRPNGMVQGTGTTSVGFANVFSSFSGFFTDVRYVEKWGWLKEYVISTSPDQSQFSGSSAEAYYRYSIGAFIFKEVRESWPKSADYTKASLYDGFWESLNNAQETEFVHDSANALPVPYRLYHKFMGWYATADFSGEALTYVNGSMTLYAKWEEEIAAESISFTNPIDELERYGTYQLEWQINPSNVANKEVKFSSSDESVAVVSETGLVTALSNGNVTITVTSLSSSGVSGTVTFNVYEPDHFEVSYETESYVTVGSEIRLNALYENKNNTVSNVVWTSLNNDIATVNNGAVKGVKAGLAKIRASVSDEIYFDFNVTVLNVNLSEAAQFVVASHESNVFTRYDLGIGAGVPVYYADIIGGVNKLLCNYTLEYNTSYLQACMNNGQYSNGLTQVEFIVVHYTAGMTKGSNAEATARFFSGNSGASAHFCTGNDGVFQTLELDKKGWHAGDGASTTFTWNSTGVAYTEGDPQYPIWGISSNAKFTINGKETTITVPYKEQRGSEGYVTDSKWLNDQGFAFKIVDGEYLMGTTWWCYSNVWEGRICSRGGNKHGIGIESAVDEGSDLWLTWQITAKLCAQLMVQYNLDITRVKGHHFFAAKDCPQPLLENDQEIWWEFIAMVEAEYEAMTSYKDVSFKLNVIEGSDIINEYGRVVEQPQYSTSVTYEVEIGNGETVTLSSIIPGIYTK